jgi:hypothetical protein
MHYRHPDLEADESSPEDLGGIDGWLETRRGVRHLPSNKVKILVEDLPVGQEIFVLPHWPDMEAP